MKKWQRNLAAQQLQNQRPVKKLGNNLKPHLPDLVYLENINNFKWSDLAPGVNCYDAPILVELCEQFKIRFSQKHYPNLEQNTVTNIGDKINSKARSRFFFVYKIYFIIVFVTYACCFLYPPLGELLLTKVVTAISAGWGVTGIMAYRRALQYTVETFKSKIQELDDKAFLNILSKVLAEDSLGDRILATVVNTVSAVKLPSVEACRQALQTVTQLIVERDDKDRERKPRRGPKITPATAEAVEKKAENKSPAPTNETIKFPELGKLLHEGTIYQVPADQSHFGKNSVVFVAFSAKFQFGQNQELYINTVKQAAAGPNHMVKYEKHKGQYSEIILNVQKDIKPTVSCDPKKNEYQNADQFESWVQREMSREQADTVCKTLYSKAGGRGHFRLVFFEQELNHAQRGFSRM